MQIIPKWVNFAELLVPHIDDNDLRGHTGLIQSMLPASQSVLATSSFRMENEPAQPCKIQYIYRIDCLNYRTDYAFAVILSTRTNA